MNSTATKKPKTMAELMPGLSGILSKDAMQTLTARKPPRPTIAATRTAEKILKPMTLAEMRADIQVLKVNSPRRYAQATASTKKKWNSSVKLDNKTVSHTANGQMKHNSVRKVLNFQPPKPKVPKMATNTTSRVTMMNTETPKFPKPEIKAKKSIHLQARNTVRISGICNIPETPLLINPPPKSRMTLANKENLTNQAILKKIASTPKSALRKRLLASRVPDTPLSNGSWKSSCDDSFLQNEKNIENSETKKVLSEEPLLENIAEVSPPVSTPFTEYRHVTEYLNYSSDVQENSTDYHDNTIMSFEKTSISRENSKREESVIVSLCDLLNKATVSNSKADKLSSELDDLLEVEKQTENNIKMIENGIKTLSTIKESQMKSLQYVKKLIREKQKERTSETDKDKTVIETTKEQAKIKIEVTPTKSPVVSKPCSVIKSSVKSPAYKIPKKNSILRKKVFCKSMPNVSSLNQTPPKDMGDRALSMYLKMKEHMNFLNTPIVNKHTSNVSNTPAMTSHNLQKQLDKLYGER